MLVRVAFEFQLDKTYDYAVPDELQDSIEVGIRVEASLGHSTRTGYIIGLNPPRSHSVKYKYFNKIIEPEPIITSSLMKLSEFVANYYCSSRGKTLRCFLPASVRKRPASAALVHVVRPAKSLEEIHEQSVKILKRAPRHASVLKHLSEFYSTTIDKKCVLRLSELSARADVQPNVIRLLETRGWLEISLEKIDTEVDGTFIPSGAPKLNNKQAEAINSILESRDKFNTFLLYGITGSGKTEVYLQVIHDAVKRGKGAIVLVPEIALTPQTVERFRSRFGEDVAVLHSNLADLERFKQWWNIRDGKARIVVGARSAIFAPVKDLGVIVVDEEHERTYKQTDEQPRYNARDLAVVRGKFESCPVILGSATPSLESYYNVKVGKYKMLELPERVVAKSLPKLSLVDLQKEAKIAPMLGVISKKMRDALQECLDKKEQALLFLNRRGYCPIVICPSCSYVKPCEQCSVSLTYHKEKEQLACHLCGHTERYMPPYKCPECGGKLNVSGFGTQRIEKNINYIFPDAKIARMDRDTTTKRGSHERFLSAFARGEIDFLLGTQMIAKGLDFPNVTLVGVINADTSLHIPDFRATETTFQLITQVAGRAGRGDKPGKVIVQSFQPDHPAIICAVESKWHDYADQELKQRKELSYPPYTHLVNLILKGKEEDKVQLAAHELAMRIERKSKFVYASDKIFALLLGPAPAPLARAHGSYRWQLTIKVTSVVKALEKIIKPVVGNYKPRGVQVITDVDPM